MKALAGEKAGGAGANPFAARVLAAEDRLTALRKKRDAFEAGVKTKTDATQSALTHLVPSA